MRSRRPRPRPWPCHAGTDSDCTVNFGGAGSRREFQKYADAMKQGLLPEPEVDAALARMLRTRFELGHLRSRRVACRAAATPDSELDSPAAPRARAASLARESMVLLKNDGLLPLAERAGEDRGRRPARRLGAGRCSGNYNGEPVPLDRRRSPESRQRYPKAQVTFEPGTTFLRADGARAVPAAP